MSEIVLLIIVFGVLFVFWLWLGALFDAITAYHAKAAARSYLESREDSSATRGSVSSALQSPYSQQVSSQFQQHPQHPSTTSRS